MTAAAKRPFVDSNVWVYALMPASDFPEKTAIAAALVQQQRVCISLQVINEVCTTLLRRKRILELDVPNVIGGLYRCCDVVIPTRATIQDASRLRGLRSLSYYDGIIVASALEAGAAILYSEDMQDGVEIDSKLKIVNPFK